MIKEELLKRSPIRILEKSIHGGLGKGNLGVFVSKKGVGKTACLIHFATDQLLRGKKVLHISFSDDPQHVANWYQQVYEEVAANYKLEEATLIFDELRGSRLILHFKSLASDFAAVENNLDVYVKKGGFRPEMVIVDGVDFCTLSREHVQKWQEIAQYYQTQIWFAASLPQNKVSGKEFIEPLMDLFAVVIELNAQPDHTQLTLLKDHDATIVEKMRLCLDPKSLLITNRRV